MVKRNYGIDLLRIVSIMSVVALHILGHGKVLSVAKPLSDFSMAWFWEILAYPAVNCFVLISGFVGFRQNNYFPKLKNIISLIFAVLFYSVAICLIFKFVYPEQITTELIKDAFSPILTKQYWFFSCYFALVLISPMLNLFVDKANLKMIVSTFAVVLIFSVYSTLRDPFVFNRGYSVIWFAILYLLGAIIKKYNIADKISFLKAFIMIACCIIITWLCKIASGKFDIISWDFIKEKGGLLVSYCSPTILLISIGLVCIFAKIKIHPAFERIIKFFSSSAFSVYLIHDNLYFRKYIMMGSFTFLINYNPILFPIMLLGCILAIFLSCTIIDKIRELLFSLLRINKLSEKIEKWIKSFFNKIIKNIQKY